MAKDYSGYFTAILIILISLLWGWMPLSAQSPRFIMETDRSNIAEGETFLLDVIIEDMDGKNLQLPDVAPFKIVQGPSSSSSITIVNGKRSATQSYQYLLLATKKGKFTIAAATLKLGSRTLQSNTVTVEVSATGKNTATLSENPKTEAFVRLETEKENVYPGQQVILNLVLYTRLNIESYQILNEPDFDGFFAQAANEVRDQPQRKTINGKEYYTQVIRRWALFPQKTGIYTLGPLNCNLDIAIDNERSSFFFRDTRQETIISNSVKINVIPLPAPVPESFSGGVGNFTMSARLQKGTVMTGEAVSLIMKVEGDGDTRIVQPPLFELPVSLEKYNPSVLKEETYPVGNKINMLKEFEYIFVPSKDTILTISPEFTFIDINTDTYKSIKAGPFTVNVVKGNSKISNADQSLNSSKLSPMSDDDTLYNKQNGFFRSPLYYFLFLSIFFLSICIYYLKNYLINKKIEKEINKQNVSVVAKLCLQKAEDFKQKNNKALFYEEISKATSGYLQQKYSIPNMSADFENLIRFMHEKHISDPLILLFSDLQKKCHLARFAGVYGDMDNVFNMAGNWISEMEKMEIK